MTATESTPSGSKTQALTPVQAAVGAAGALMRLDPQQLILTAIEGGADIAVIKDLVALAKEMKAEAARDAFYAAKARFVKLCPPIKKQSKAEIPTRSGRSYSYNYTELGDLMAAINPILGECGLSVTWTTRQEDTVACPKCGAAVEGKSWVIGVATVTHELGYKEVSGEIKIPIETAFADRGANPAQRVAMAITYAERYAVQQVLGIVPQEDDDARSTGGYTEEPRDERSEDRHGDGESRPGNGDRLITAAQERMFYGVAERHGWSDSQWKALLRADDAKKILMREFDAILMKLKDGPPKAGAPK